MANFFPGASGASRALGNGENRSSEGDSGTTTGSTPGQVLVQMSGGSKRPSDDPRAVHPSRRKGSPPEVASLPQEDWDKLLGKHKMELLSRTASVLAGEHPDGLIRPFVLPGPTQVAKLFTHELARKLMLAEQRPEVIVGYGTVGGIFAADITQALLDLHCSVEFLPIDRNHRTGAEGYNFQCAESDIRSILQGKRILLALPITTSSHISEIVEVKSLIDTEQCAALVAGIVTLIQYGSLPPTLDLKVESLLSVR